MRSVSRYAAATCVLVCIISLILNSSAFGQENPRLLSFDEALRLAFADDPGLQARDYNIQVQKSKVGESTAGFNPRFDIVTGYARTSLKSEIEFVNPLTSTPLSISLFPQDRYNIGLSVMHNFFSFGRRSAAKGAAELGVDVSRLDRTAYRRSIYDNLSRVFLRVLLARDNLNIRKADVIRAHKKMDIVRSRMAEGMAADYDSIRAELLILRYENERIAAEGAFVDARASLLAILGLDQDEPVMPVGELESFEIDILEDANYDSSNNIQISKLDKSIAIQNQMLRFYKRSYLPGLAYNLRYDWQNGYQPDLNKLRGYWTAGLSLNWSLFDGGARYSKINEAKNEISQARYLKSDLSTYIAADIKSSQDDIETAGREIDVSRKRLALAERGLEIADAQYKQGLITISDLLDLELERAAAEIGVNASAFKLQLARLNLKTALGYYPELGESDNSR